MNKYKITKILNHNVVMFFDENRNEKYLAFGKGIGFGKKENDTLNENAISKLYQIKDLKNINDYDYLVKKSPDKLLEISEYIISKMQQKFKKRYNERLHISLLDHLNFAIKRYNEKIVINNLFLDEIKFMYPIEYQFSSECLDYINSTLNIKLDESEIGLISMHIHSSLNNEEVGMSSLIVTIVSSVIKFLETKYNIIIKNALLKQRLITHLKFALKRAKDGLDIDSSINSLIKEKYSKTYLVSLGISNYLKDNFKIHLKDSELSYLTIHIQNIIESNDEKEEYV